MEIKKRFNLKWFLSLLYFVCFGIFLKVGLEPAEAIEYQVAGRFYAPVINLSADVTALKMQNHQLPTPDEIIGSYSIYPNKTLLIGHSSTVFADLKSLRLRDIVSYDNKSYQIYRIDVVPKAKIDMRDVLQAESNDTIVLMTCAGQDLGNKDATHRLIITAKYLKSS